MQCNALISHRDSVDCQKKELRLWKKLLTLILETYEIHLVRYGSRNTSLTWLNNAITPMYPGPLCDNFNLHWYSERILTRCPNGVAQEVEKSCGQNINTFGTDLLLMHMR